MDPELLGQRLQKLTARLGSRRGVRHVVVAAAALDESWVWREAAGEANPHTEPMTPDIPWFTASVTKLHIAAVVLRLWEQGLVDLNAPVTTCMPADLAARLHLYDGVDYTDRVTPTHLLGHLSGLPDYLTEKPRGGRALIDEIMADGDRAWSPYEAVRRARDNLTPHFPPSDPESRRPRISYSDTNYMALVAVAEHVTGRRMSDLYRELVWEPRQLRHTWLPGESPLDLAGEPATVWFGDRPLVDRPLAMQSFGDLYSTADDLLRFGRALFTGSLFDDPATGDVLLRRFNRFGFPRSMTSVRSPSWPIEYGLGVMRFELSRLMAGGLRIPCVVGHSGSTGSWLWYAPELQVLLAGTVDQTRAAAVPFRAVPRALSGLSRAGG